MDVLCSHLLVAAPRDTLRLEIPQGGQSTPDYTEIRPRWAAATRDCSILPIAPSYAVLPCHILQIYIYSLQPSVGLQLFRGTTYAGRTSTQSLITTLAISATHTGYGRGAACGCLGSSSCILIPCCYKDNPKKSLHHDRRTTAQL